jgi:hypothetical protein
MTHDVSSYVCLIMDRVKSGCYVNRIGMVYSIVNVITSTQLSLQSNHSVRAPLDLPNIVYVFQDPAFHADFFYKSESFFAIWLR